MFNNCKSLSELPEISKWNLKNVIDINYMFYNCKSLSKNIPNWDLNYFHAHNFFNGNISDENNSEDKDCFIY